MQNPGSLAVSLVALMCVTALCFAGVHSVQLNGIGQLVTSPKGYNEVIAEEMVAYAAAATCSDAGLLQRWGCKVCIGGHGAIPAPPGLVNVSVISDEDNLNQALLGFDPANERIVASFRGSVDIEQWIFDLDVTPVHAYCNHCFVHHGFLLAWKDLEADFIIDMKRLLLQHNEAEIYFTGHSLGAAAALHAALTVAALGERKIHGYTFGQPRVGNKEFATFAREALRSPWFRIVNYHDPVVQLPKVPGLYEHLPVEVYFFEKPEPGQSPGPFYVCSYENGEDPNCQNKDCGGLFQLCVDGAFHTTYMNLEGITDVKALC